MVGNERTIDSGFPFAIVNEARYLSKASDLRKLRASFGSSLVNLISATLNGDKKDA